MLQVIRALDIAGDEGEGPLWVMLPHLKRLKDRSVNLAARTDVAPLRVTLHAGEDFRHLASGLRAIHEPFMWGLMERGDRLGHALALGLDAAQWCEQHPIVFLTRWERMLDLSWMIAALRRRLPGLSFRGGHEMHAMVLDRLCDELRSRLRECALDQTENEMVDLVTQDLADPAVLSSLLDLHETPATNDRRFILEQRLRGGAIVQARLDAVVQVTTADECDLLVDLGKALVGLLGQLQIVIELNPSSNLLIAGLEYPLDQPIFRLHPLDGENPNALPVTLNADDPLTFATNLADEFAYTWAALTVAAGVPSGYARAWMNEAARTSWRARFTLTARV